jgi:hypothetical protein
VQEQEQLAAGAPPPLEPTPTQADEATLASVAQTATVAPPAQQDVSGQQPSTGYTVKNPYTLMPSSVNMAGANLSTPKSKVERSYDIGRFWQVLASDPNASELTRMVAKSLTGQRK